MKSYHIYGNTFQIKEDLKAWACTWNPSEKRWETPPTSKDEISYKRLRSLVESVGGTMVAAAETEKDKRIQDILNKRSK